MSKSRVRKKKGKPVKYTPKPTGISKTKMKKLMELLEQYNKQTDSNENPEVSPLRNNMEGDLIIPEEFTKKMNMASSDEHNEGPELSMDQNNENSDEENSKEEIQEESTEDNVGPQSSDI